MNIDAIPPPPALASATAPRQETGTALARNSNKVSTELRAAALRPPTEAQGVEPPPGRESVSEAIRKANESIGALRSNLQFTVDEATGVSVIKIIDAETHEVIRQIPAEEMLAIAKRLDELKGLLIREQA